MREIVPDPDERFVDDDRLDRIRDAVSEAPVDGLAAFAPANSYYLTGCYAGMYSRPVVGVVTEEESVFVGPRLEEQKAARTAWTDHALLYEDSDDPVAVLAEAVPEDVGALGYDADLARPDWVEGLRSRTSPEFTDESELFRSLRVVKTDWELGLIRRARDLASAGCEALIEDVRSGTPEIEVASAVQNAYYETYLEEHPEYDLGTANELGQYGFASVLAGPHALEPHALSSSRRIGDGDTVVGIALPAIQGYVCEKERTILVGDVDEEIEAAMETLVEVREETIDRVGPGVSVAELDAWTTEKLKQAGYGNQIRHRTGHGEGITIHEGPALNARSAGQLEPGMVISIEPGLYFEGNALRHSDTVVVTEDGSERLTEPDAGIIRAK